jgi:hypothetical protein
MRKYGEVDPKDAHRQLVEDAIVEWRETRAQRLEAQRIVDAMQKEESKLKSWLIAVFQAQAFEGMVINQRITGLSTREVHSVTDKAAFVQYVYDWEAIDLLQFRLSETAIVEREDIGQAVPGLEIVEAFDLFDRKA